MKKNYERGASLKKLLPKLKRTLSNVARALTGKYIAVKESEDPNAIGYTSEKREIYISSDNEFLKKLSLPEQVKFYKGVFTHELLHQLLTNFKCLNRVTFKSEAEKRIVHTIHNIVEDPRIENFAPLKIGEKYVDDLLFSKVVIYKSSPDLDESKTPFSQFMNACIQYGDLGLLKGNFTFPEARKIFAEILPLFDSAIEEPSCDKALKYVLEIAEKSRPLWEAEAELEEMLSQLAKEMSKNFGSPNTSALSPVNKNSASSPSSTPNNNRKITRMKVTKEEAEELTKNAQQGNAENADEIIVLDVDDSDDETSAESNVPLSSDVQDAGSGSQSESNSSTDDSSDDANASDDDSNKSDDADASSSTNENNSSDDSNSSDDGDESNDDLENSNSSDESETSDKNDGSITDNSPLRKQSDSFKKSEAPKKTETEIDIDKLEEQLREALSDVEDYHIPDEEIAELNNEIDRYINGSNEILDDETDETEPIDIPDIKSKYFSKAKVLNKNMIAPESAQSQYDLYVKQLGASINMISHQFQRFFKNKVEEREYTTSGKVNLNRVNSGRVTSRVFERRRSPANKFDFSIALAIDESGSMCGDNTHYARLAAITIAEVCKNLNIPLYVMGFTTGGNYDAVHHHYIKWKNNTASRRNLTGIGAYNCNFDGYTVRYMNKLIQKRTETNKLIIVISDGTPSASIYGGGYNNVGIADTKIAIKEANKNATVLGVAIGNADKEALHEMYGLNFLYVQDVSTLAKNLARKIFQIIKSV